MLGGSKTILSPATDPEQGETRRFSRRQQPFLDGRNRLMNRDAHLGRDCDRMEGGGRTGQSVRQCATRNHMMASPSERWGTLPANRFGGSSPTGNRRAARSPKSSFRRVFCMCNCQLATRGRRWLLAGRSISPDIAATGCWAGNHRHGFGCLHLSSCLFRGNHVASTIGRGEGIERESQGSRAETDSEAVLTWGRYGIPAVGRQAGW